jgi:hypothetical protein
MLCGVGHRHGAGYGTHSWGQVFIAETREVVFHAERAILSAGVVIDGPREILNVLGLLYLLNHLGVV